MKKIIYSIYLILLGFACPVSAQGLKSSEVPLNAVSKQSGVTEGNVGNVVGGLISGVLTLVGVIFLVLMVYAGILWMTARGKDDQIEKARDIIIASLIGLFIVVSAYAITVFVTSRF
ncbi:MAG: hypothetical protein COU81_02605 [Candidatus Portnoybacteria bacterium CG10_big_fil_rev_8_21_14_0_10_36_7]|uniref:DUF4190 domain-containing protein n=1 Tax=Candidatus Portnoybacteria bacterium CG10_big_fil_rev_8_21_14_0_10_36_7 TaxID=1974812 RepID=A0A2M8KDV0_9BACT|nr:MAG: hypothetical protein COU81_02605 [Candidatus Portnoybacteria bacterium CG10_big_fil_rev_8_21_14_0_10_36_7]